MGENYFHFNITDSVTGGRGLQGVPNYRGSRITGGPGLQEVPRPEVSQILNRPSKHSTHFQGGPISLK